MGSRILIVEDNPDNLKLMSYLLTSFGHTVLTAVDGEEGLAVASREPLDMVVCDIQLPKVDGYEVARRLKEQETTRHMPLVGVTALAMVGDRDKVLGAGFDGYISKPIVPRTFVNQIEEFLGKRSVPLPIPVVQPSSSAPGSAPAKRGVILVVDNTAINIELARRILQPFGYEVVAAFTIQEAMTRLRQSPPDLILCDLHLSRESGHDLIRKIKEEDSLRTIPFVFLSSTASNEKEHNLSLALGADKFLVRPISPQTLLAEIESCMARKTEE